MKFFVTKELIEKGRKSGFNYLYCPVALAIREKGFVDVRVFDIYAVVNQKKYRLARRVRDFIRKFDTKKLIKPIEFSLNIREDRIRS